MTRGGDLPLDRANKPRSSRGLTYIEMLFTMALIMVLAAAAFPLHHWNEKRLREAELRVALTMMRQAIDKYNEYCEAGLIVQTDVEQLCYPLSLEELVEGVEVGDPDSPESKNMTFLARIPTDPFTGDTDWGVRSYQDDWDGTSWGGENVYDVYSQAEGIALDGTEYGEW